MLFFPLPIQTTRTSNRLINSLSSINPYSSTSYFPLRMSISTSSHRKTLPLPTNDQESKETYGEYSAPTLDRAKEVKEKLEGVRKRVEIARGKARELGVGEDEPRLVAISKLHPPSSILAAHLHTGQRHFGENYVQELVEKSKVLPSNPEDGIRWHFVGGLQSNKGKLLASVPNLYLLETLDSIKASKVLEKALSSPEAVKRDGPLFVYLQVNTSGEGVKSGLPPLLNDQKPEEHSSEKGESLLDLTKHVILYCPNLRFKGLMTIGSSDNSQASKSAEDKNSIDEILKLNPDFERLVQSRENLVKVLREDGELKKLEGEIKEDYEELLEGKAKNGGLELSMGMSNDLELAVKCGSRNVRVGTDCFGQRMGSRDEAMKAMEAELKMEEKK